jgi:hypothetical protein
LSAVTPPSTSAWPRQTASSFFSACDGGGVGEAPFLQVKPAVGERKQSGVVGDDEDGGAVAFGGRAEQFHDAPAVAPVEGAGRFVREAEGRLLDQGAADADALLFAAGELAGTQAGLARQTQAIQNLLDAPPRLPPRHLAPPAQHHIQLLVGGQGREQVVPLEGEAAVAQPEVLPAAIGQAPQVLPQAGGASAVSANCSDCPARRCITSRCRRRLPTWP